MTTHQESLHNHSRIIFLDYLRIFAFSSVIIGHKFYDQLQAYADNPATLHAQQFIINLLLPLFYCGGAGVVVFFFVSGYIITHVLQTEKTLEFVIKRIFRIYPLYMAAVLIQNSRSILLCILSPHLISERLPTLLSQLFLVGDLFGTNYSLYGIEWTLRIEVVFYLYMALLHSLGIMQNYKRLFPYILIATALLLTYLPAFPTWNETTIGNTNIYAPFLMLGAIMYLAEKKQIHYAILPIVVLLVFFRYHAMIETYQPRWLGAHFALLAFLIFASAWALRRHLPATTFVLFASDLTYAAYLFHSWHYKYIKDKLTDFSITFLPLDLTAMVILLIVCILAVKYIEKPGIRLGRYVISRLGQKN